MKYKAIGFDFNGVISDGHILDTELLELLIKLRKLGFKLGIISNFGKSGAEHIRQLGIDKYVDVLHVSGETGYAKPQPEAFTHLAEELNVFIEELIFVDDSPYCLSTAQQTGYEPIIYENLNQLTEHLKSNGIKI